MIMLLVSILLSHGLVSLLRDSLMGHHPTELLDLYLRQDTVLNALEEGLVATDSTGLWFTQIRRQRVSFHVLPETPEDPPSVSPDDGTSGQEQTKPLMEGRTFRDFFPESQADRRSSRPAHRPTTVPAPVRTEDFWSVRFRWTPRRSIR